MFRLSNDDDVPELRTLWKKCFDADRAFLDLFFEKGYGLTRTYVMETGDGIVSALSIFPVEDMFTVSALTLNIADIDTQCPC